jgi:poly(3-hydroxybutyrate) depolymerase
MDTDFDTGSTLDTDVADFDTSTSTSVEDGTDEVNPNSGCGASSWPKNGEYGLRVNDTQREYIVNIPDNYDPQKTYRLIFVWHYRGGMASQVVRNGYLGLKKISDNSTIFVAGQGLISTDRTTDWANISGGDIAFAKQLFERLRLTYCIDENRVFSAGWDSGGTMSNNVGCKLGNIFRAIASISGSGPAPTRFNRINCIGNTAAWIAQGMGNNNVSNVAYANGIESRDYWKDANNCGDGQDNVWPGSCVAYKNCLDGYPVHWCTYLGDYQVPDFAAIGIWSFFSQF